MKLTLKFNKLTKMYEVIFNNQIIGEFFTGAVAERFMVGKSCSMIIRDILKQ